MELYLGNTVWLILEKICRLITNVVISILMARCFGVESFGVLSYVQSLFILLYAIVGLGLDPEVVKLLVIKSEDKEKILGTALYLKLIVAALLVIVMSVGLIFSNQNALFKSIFFVFLIGLLFQPYYVYRNYFEANVKGKYITYSSLISSFFSGVLKIIVLMFCKSLLLISFFFVFDYLIEVCLLSFYYKRINIKKCRWNIDREFAYALLKNSFPLLVSAIMVSLYMRLDQIMIKSILGAYDVGLYSAAIRISEGWYFIPMVISTSYYPYILKMKNISENLYAESLVKLNSFLVWLGILIGIFFTFFSNDVVLIIYGKEYIDSAFVLNISIWTGIFVSLGVVSSRWFVIENLQRYTLIRTLVGLSVNLMLNLFLIPRFGVSGAAASTLIAQFFASYFANILNKNTFLVFKIQTKSFVYPVLLVKRNMFGKYEN